MLTNYSRTIRTEQSRAGHNEYVKSGLILDLPGIDR